MLRDFGYAQRESYWRGQIATLCGRGTAEILDFLAQCSSGTRVAIVPFGSRVPSGGELAAALLLHRICHSDSVTSPPCRIVVLPDNVRSRSGYPALKISVGDVEGLLNAWRLRAVGHGRVPGDYLPVEKALRARRRRRDDDLVPFEGGNLHLFFPAFRTDRTGNLISIASRYHLPGAEESPAVVFTDVIAIPEWPGLTLDYCPDYTVVECRGAVGELDAKYFERLSRTFEQTRLIWILPDLGHPLFNKLYGRGVKVCWYHAEPAGVGPERKLNPSPAAPTLRWSPAGWQGERADLERLLHLLLDARREAKAAKQAEGWAALGLLKAAILVLTTLPVTRQCYDAAAVEHFRTLTTSELLSALASEELRVATTMPSLAASLEESHAILSAILNRLDAANPRANQIIQRVEEGIGNGQGVCLVVRSRAMRAAMESYLTMSLNTDLGDLLATGIRVETRADVSSGNVEPGPRPFLWTAYSSGPDLEAILRHQALGLTVLLGPIERELFRGDLGRWVNRATVAQQGTEALGLPAQGTAIVIEALEALAAELKSSVPLRSADHLPFDVEELFADQEAQAKADRKQTSGDLAQAMRPAFRVAFEEDGMRAYFPEHGLLTVLRAGKSDPIEVTVRELRPGDRVVFVDKAVGRTLYELMQDQLVRSPIVGAAAQVVRLWHRALGEGYRRSNRAFHEVLSELRQSGSTITSDQTVRSWVRGGVLGPQDLTNVDRIAGILGIARRDGRIIEEVKRGIAGMRKVHRSFARIVYRSILSLGAGGQLSDADEALLEEHGLQLKDLREAVSIMTVANVAETAEQVPIGTVGTQIEG